MHIIIIHVCLYEKAIQQKISLKKLVLIAAV